MLHSSELVRPFQVVNSHWDTSCENSEKKIHRTTPLKRRIQMRKISMFAAALVLIGVGAWTVTTNQRVAASTPAGIDPLQMMANAKDLPATQYVDYTLIFN